LKFNISGFTNIGTQRKLNQDRILIQDTVFADGADYVQEIENCFCFIADGIGGGPAGDYAAQFVLEQIAMRISSDTKYSNDELLLIIRLKKWVKV
jgi:serine/threonine protein phosphatase PrpC